jgi:hypothetical protein
MSFANEDRCTVVTKGAAVDSSPPLKNNWPVNWNLVAGRFLKRTLMHLRNLVIGLAMVIVVFAVAVSLHGP